VWCASRSLLPTAATIVAVGASAVVAGAAGAVAAHLLDAADDLLVAPLVTPLAAHLAAPAAWRLRAGLGAGLGYATSWGSEQGYYHTVLLPLMAVCMQGTARQSIALHP